jgi:hypothetical protein
MKSMPMRRWLPSMPDSTGYPIVNSEGNQLWYSCERTPGERDNAERWYFEEIAQAKKEQAT